MLQKQPLSPNEIIKKMLSNIDDFLKLKMNDAALKTFWATIVRLQQVSNQELAQITDVKLIEELGKLLLKTLLYKIENNAQKVQFLERMSTVIEKYHQIKPDILADLNSAIISHLGTFRGKAKRLDVPKPAITIEQRGDRIDDAEFQLKLTSLMEHTRAITECRARATDPVQLQDAIAYANISSNEFYARQGSYWGHLPTMQKWLDFCHDEINSALRSSDKAKGKQAYIDLHYTARSLIRRGYYNRARDLLAYTGSVENNAYKYQEVTLTYLFGVLIDTNDCQLDFIRTKVVEVPPWSYLIENIKKLRSNILNELLENKSIQSIHIKSSTELRTEFNKCMQATVAMIGLCPVRMCVVANGSLSKRSDANPIKSDADIAIVYELPDGEIESINNPLYLQAMMWIQNLLQSFEYEITGLGESRDNVKGMFRGIHYDRSCIIDINDKSIEKVGVYNKRDYFANCKRAFLNKASEGNADYTQLQPRYLFGDMNFYKECTSKFQKLTDEELRFAIKVNISELERAAQTNPKNLNDVDLKNDYLHPLRRAIVQLAIYSGVPDQLSYHPLDLLNWLLSEGKEVTNEKNSPAGRPTLRDGLLDWRFVKLCRDKLTLLYRYQIVNAYCEFGFADKLNAAGLVITPDQLLEELKIIREEILKPLADLSKRICNGEPIPPRKIHPAKLPDGAGNRYHRNLRKMKWQQCLIRPDFSSIQPSAKVPKVLLNIPNIGNRYLCQKSIELLVENGVLTKEGLFSETLIQRPEGLRVVCDDRIEKMNLAITVFMVPTPAAMCHSLFMRLIGEGFKSHTFCLISDSSGTKHYYALLSQTGAFFRNNKDLYKLQIELESMDFDRAYALAFIAKILNINIELPDNLDVFCLNKYRAPFNLNVLTEILSMDIYQLVSQWLSELLDYERAFKRPSFMFTEGFITRIYQKLVELQMILSTIDTTSNLAADKSYAYVLEQLDPALGQYYATLHATFGEEEKRIKANGIAIPSAQTTSQVLIKAETALLELARARQAKPESSAEERYGNSILTSLKRAKGDNLKLETIINGIDFSKLKKTDEKKIIDIMKEVRFKKLRLNGCSISMSDLILLINQNSDLVDITLKNMHEVDGRIWDSIKANRNIKFVHMDNLSKMTLPVDGLPENFLLRLSEFGINQCPKIVEQLNLKDIEKDPNYPQRPHRKDKHQLGEILRLIEKCPILLTVKRETWVNARVSDLVKFILLEQGMNSTYYGVRLGIKELLPYLLALKQTPYVNFTHIVECGLDMPTLRLFEQSISCNPAIDSLSFPDNRMTVDEMRVLADIIVNRRKVIFLTLSKNPINDNGFLLILNSLQKHTDYIEILNACNCEITSKCVDAIIEFIGKSSVLRIINLEKNKINEHGVKRLMQAAEAKEIKLCIDGQLPNFVESQVITVTQTHANLFASARRAPHTPGANQGSERRVQFLSSNHRTTTTEQVEPSPVIGGEGGHPVILTPMSSSPVH